MQLANGCGSGTLYAAGGGSRRMWVVLPFFCLGGLLGSLVLPAALNLPTLPPVGLGEMLGPWGGLAAALTLAGALMVLLLRHGPRPNSAQLLAGNPATTVVRGRHPGLACRFGQIVWQPKLDGNGWTNGASCDKLIGWDWMEEWRHPWTSPRSASRQTFSHWSPRSTSSRVPGARSDVSHRNGCRVCGASRPSKALARRRASRGRSSAT